MPFLSLCYNLSMFTKILILLLGWGCGILVNYLSDVLPWRRKLAAPLCMACQAPIPVINYLLWPRRCPACSKRRSWRVLFVELVFMGITFWLWQAPTERLGFWGGLLLLVYFGVVVVIDLEHRLILHMVSIFGAFLGLVLGVVMRGWWSTVIGGVAGFLIMLCFYWLGDKFARWMSRRRGQEIDEEALGFGDVNLGGVLGLILGWPGIFVGLFIGALIGGLVSLVYLVSMGLLRRYKLFTPLPYGPSLVAGAILLLFFRDWLLRLF